MLHLKPIIKIDENHYFFIPDYQRGYRWTERNVNELLNDLMTYALDKTTESSSIYCLQPIVVKEMSLEDIRLDGKNIKGKKVYELCDGQQRLTSIFLILKFLNYRFIDEFKKSLFVLDYATRERSYNFLQKIIGLDLSDEDKRENIDFYHMTIAYETIATFFQESENKKHINLFESALLFDANVIWYELDEETDAKDVFRRLNSGKIRLTNAELVKALFLGNKGQNLNDSEKLYRYKISMEWEQIENELQNDKFWYFLANKKESLENRIEFIFRLIANELNKSEHDKIPIPKKDSLYVFLTFNEYFKNHQDIEQNWLLVKNYFLKFKDWYDTPKLYHYIGFLLTDEVENVSIENVLKWSTEAEDKGAFEQKLLEIIEENIEVTLDNLGYDKVANSVRRSLLWFNIYTILKYKAQNIRFQFDEFKNVKWDIEHIKSVDSNIPTERSAQNNWLHRILEFLSGEQKDELKKADYKVLETSIEHPILFQEICSALKSKSFTQEDFKNLYKKVLKTFDENSYDSKVENRVGNLCLLDSTTNRSYKNAIFPVKRKQIIHRDLSGQYILPCTKNAFLKSYSSKLGNMLQWTKTDMEDYEYVLETALNPSKENLND